MKEDKSVVKEGLSSKDPANCKPVVETTGQRVKARSDSMSDSRGKFKAE